ncbi:uncharacterized protein DFL_004306 [Arthrobotrys flagrans]|uniref:Uncharacterized protein n=1 Tax=Arthrobotrys flagrans TaxID=97331 RepID=A0A437A4K1_ARTFL|nr:hypothetical protein DFL_004306 [Arthrobotrys flagrans]
MASRLKLRKTPPQKGNDRGIQLGLIWLGKRLEPIDQDSRCQFYECTWQLGRYQRQTSRENEPYESEISNSPPMEFDLEINHERWEVDGYRIDVGYVEGHNHDFKRIGSICQWFAWKSITKATHAVDLDAPWHIQARFNAPTDNFLPSKHNNPGGKVTVIINMFRDGREKDRWKGIERFAWEVDGINKPLAQFIFKMSFQGRLNFDKK